MQKGVSILASIITIIVVILIVVAGFFAFQYFMTQQAKPVACTMEAKICSDGSSVGRTGPSCEFAPCPTAIVYKNTEFGFQIILPDSWNNYTVDGGKIWHGNNISDSNIKYDGPMIVIINPKTTPTVQYQDIPIMVLTKEQWNLIGGPNPTVSVSAAPIGPEKIGENSKYIFATPPRWWGFTDALDGQEAADAVKTFKAF